MHVIRVLQRGYMYRYLRAFYTVPVTVVTDGPHVTLTGGNLTLRCITQGIPRPQYEWVLGQGFVGLLYILIN